MRLPVSDSECDAISSRLLDEAVDLVHRVAGNNSAVDLEDLVTKPKAWTKECGIKQGNHNEMKKLVQTWWLL